MVFEAFALTLAREMPVTVCAKLLRRSDGAPWRVLDAQVEAARARESHVGVHTLGIDETACARRQHSIALVHDLGSRRLLFATAGRDAATLETAVEDLRAHGGTPDAIDAVCMDMSRTFIAGVGQNLPQAAIAFDRFHVIHMANGAVDAVRREEVRTAPKLKCSRWALLKDVRRWTQQQLQAMHLITYSQLKTARPWRLKESARNIYRASLNCEQTEQAEESPYFRSEQMLGEEVFTVKEIATLLKVGEKTVYSMAQAGELPAFKVRGQWRFARKDIDAWIEQQKHTTHDFGEEDRK